MLYEYECVNGHRKDSFIHLAVDLGCETEICDCGNSMGKILSGGYPLLYFEEGRGRWIANLAEDGNPVYVTSAAQHNALMKKNKVAIAPARKGGKGTWV